MKIINTTDVHTVPIRLLKEGQFFEVIGNNALYIFTYKTGYDDLNGYHATCLNNGHTITLTDKAMVMPVIIEEVKYRYGVEEGNNNDNQW